MSDTTSVPALFHLGKNHLVDCFPKPQQEQFMAKAELVSIEPLGEQMFEQGQRISHCYFPCSGIVSQVAAMRSGDLVEVGIIGCEGMVGLGVALGDKIAQHRAIVQTKGQALKISAEDFLELYD